MKAEGIDQEMGAALYQAATASEVPEAPETFNKATTALQVATKWDINSNERLLEAGVFRDTMKDIEKEINETFDAPINAAFKAHRAIVAAKKKYSEPLEEAIRLIKQKMIVWTQEQERIRRLEQARLDLEAKKKAEEEALELAATLEAAGAGEAAAQILDEPIQPAAVILPRAVPKIAGFSSSRRYNIEITDRKAFVAGIVAGKIPDQAWEKADTFCRQQAQSLNVAMNWPGTKLVWKDV